jgi:hypothetical protein
MTSCLAYQGMKRSICSFDTTASQGCLRVHFDNEMDDPMKPLKTRCDSKMPAVGFQKLPLELRNEIYFHIIRDVVSITIPSRTPNFLDPDYRRQHLHKLLPSCLNLCRQIRDEAIKEMQLTTMHIITKITARNPDDLLKALPATTRLSGVRQLVFTSDQMSYTQPHGSASCSVRDAVSRCPQLSELVLQIPVEALFDNPEFSRIGDKHKLFFGPIQEHYNLPELFVSVVHYRRDVATRLGPTDSPDVRVTEPIAKVLGCIDTLREPRFSWSIDLSKGQQTNRPLLSRRRSVCVTHVSHFDPLEESCGMARCNL